MTKQYRRLSIAFSAFVAIFLASASMASAQNQRFLAGGLPTSSPQAAAKSVMDYADLNSGYGAIIARQTGSRTFNKNDYRAAGWGTASASTMNSALSSSGSPVAFPDSSSVGVKTVRIRNVKTGLLVNVMVRCGNPRVKKGVRVIRKVKVHRILRIWVDKKFSVKKSITCPGSNQTVSGTVKGRVRGWFKTKVKGWTTGARLHYRQSVDIAVRTKLTLKCVGTPPPPPAQSNKCSIAGTPVDANGNCVNQSNSSTQEAEVKNDCKGTIYGNQCVTTIVQVTIQINANCSQVILVNGDNPNMVLETNPVICSTVTPPPPPPPTCPSGTTGTFPNCVTPPPPPPAASATCTGLTVVTTQVAKEVRGSVTYNAQHATLTNVTFNWGDGSSTNAGNATSATHVYPTVNQFLVVATLRFTTNTGGTITSTCDAVHVTPKDGTATPPPPPEAPGPNPPPSPEEPYPGGYQCYSETTGAPVTPRSDGTCPPGSYGGPA